MGSAALQVDSLPAELPEKPLNYYDTCLIPCYPKCGFWTVAAELAGVNLGPCPTLVKSETDFL